MFEQEHQDPESVKALIIEVMTSQLNAFKSEVLEEMNTRNGALAARFDREIDRRVARAMNPQGDEAPATSTDTNATGNASDSESSSGGRLTTRMAALSKENADLRAMFEAMEKKAAQKSLNATLSDLCASNKVRPEAFAAVRDAFLFRNQSKLKSEESSNDPDALDWFLSLSDSEAIPLSKAFSNYLATDEGKLFVAHNAAQGSGVKEQPKQLTFAAPTSNSQSADDPFRAIAAQMLSQ